jgi:hypothetical protein
MKINSVEDLKNEVMSNQQFQEALRLDPIKALEEMDIVKPLDQDVWIYRIVVSVLGIAVILSALGAIILVFVDKQTPEVLIALGSASVGALAGLLAPSPK